jgi:hypothetical protein
MIVEGGIYAIIIPIGRTIAALAFSIMLGIMGGWIATTFNAMIEYTWEPALHRNIYLVGIALGAGGGAYLAWMNLSLRWYLIAASVLAVLLGGVIGTYAGYAYGYRVEPTYFGRGYTVDNAVHLGAAFGGAGVATLLGLINEIRTLGR